MGAPIILEDPDAAIPQIDGARALVTQAQLGAKQ